MKESYAAGDKLEVKKECKNEWGVGVSKPWPLGSVLGLMPTILDA
jgi:hypothetical protein